MELVAPLIPDAQKNRGPDLFLESMRGGLAAFAQMAQLRRQSESDAARMALQERLAQEAHDLDARKLDMAADMIPYQQKLIDSQSELGSARAKAYADGTATTAQRTIKFNQQMESLMEDFNTQAEKRGLLDPKFASKDPVQFAMNVLNQKDEFAMAGWEPRIRNGLTQFQRIADQQKIAYGSDKKPKPIWQIVENLSSADPEIKAKTIEDLKSAGHVKTQTTKGKPTQQWTRPIDSLWDKFIGPTDTTEEVPSDTLGALQDKTSTFERVPSRVPPTMLPKGYSAGTQPTAMPEPDLPPIDDPNASARPASSATPDFQPTDTDKLIESAMKAIRAGAPAKAVAARLRENGIDPNALWQT